MVSLCFGVTACPRLDLVNHDPYRLFTPQLEDPTTTTPAGEDSTNLRVVPRFREVAITKALRVNITGGTPPYALSVASGDGEFIAISEHAGSFVAGSAPGLVALRVADAKGVVVYTTVSVELGRSVTSLPTSQRFKDQWGLDNLNTDSDMDAPEGWKFNTDCSREIIAVLDTGADPNHPALSTNLWKNPGELDGEGRALPNGVDDDHNGYVDDIYGINLIQHNGNIMDDSRNSHGTHVSAIIAGSNAGQNALVGTVGVCWMARLMVLKFLNQDGVGSTALAVEGMAYAARQRVRVVNNSWGRADATDEDLIRAIAGHGDMLFVSAAGNDRCNEAELPEGAVVDPRDPMAPRCPGYPAGYNIDNILSVGATNSFNQKYTSSNWGVKNVDIGAPGQGILSAIVPSVNGTYGSAYGLQSGTSMAAPFVAGAAASYWSMFPAKSVAEVKKQILLSTSKDENLYDIFTTAGVINLYDLLNPGFEPIPPKIQITQVEFLDEDQNSVIAAGERIVLIPEFRNAGQASADQVRVTLLLDNRVADISDEAAVEEFSLSSGEVARKPFELRISNSIFTGRLEYHFIVENVGKNQVLQAGAFKGFLPIVGK